MAKDDGGPAFPVIGIGPPLQYFDVNDPKKEMHTIPGSERASVSGGMSLRDWFAGQALAGLFANVHTPPRAFSTDSAIVAAYLAADMMLEERKK
jgi:hypothetical protein